ncbi:hypothetical protein C1752_00254 [Acaryochloris thomasi RCC1774]|uniref:UspA domain-containing protein n=1 Tax=Acaryochloris thomasi RCC1774 TaxID=1764569 RepID=A0A2W1JY69_9CYAN|nr:universal stress protein [Acaryochloris thomasi]PZD75215.1 hypothetical protein C1752_00254 [Acaryochloris thomasi RCC1774]
MKHILLCTDGSEFSDSSYRYAAWFAPRLEAEIEVLNVSDVRSQKMANQNLSGAIGINASQELLNKFVELEYERSKIKQQKSQLILENAEASLAELGIPEVTLTHQTGYFVDSLHECEQHSDLLILGQRGEGAGFNSEHLGSKIERVIRSINTPCLVTPQNYRPIRRLVLAYDGGQSCQNALQFLVNSSAFNDLELHIVIAAKQADDPQAKAHLQEAEAQARSGSFTPIARILVGHPEQEIMSYIEQQQMDLLIMGAYGHSRIRSLIIGSTTAYLLRESDIPVLLFRH